MAIPPAPALAELPLTVLLISTAVPALALRMPAALIDVLLLIVLLRMVMLPPSLEIPPLSSAVLLRTVLWLMTSVSWL